MLRLRLCFFEDEGAGHILAFVSENLGRRFLFLFWELVN